MKNSEGLCRYLRLLALAGSCVLSPLLPAEDKPAANPADGAAASATARVLPTPQEDKLALLASAQSPETEIIWLETQRESFLGLYLPANAGEPLGAALLLHHNLTSPDWPGTIQTLRRGLPDQGWHTLSIALPAEPATEIPARGGDSPVTAATTEAPAAASTDTTDAASDSSPADAHAAQQALGDQVNERIEAAVRQLEARGATRLMLIGVGSGAYWAGAYLKAVEDQRPLDLTLIDAQAPGIPTRPPLNSLIAELKSPTLDLFHGSGLKNRNRDTSSVAYQAEQRLKESRRQQRMQYTQRRLPPRPVLADQPDRRLLASFRGLFRKFIQQPRAEAGAKAAMAAEKTPGQ